jgi:hypothetical protein
MSVVMSRSRWAAGGLLAAAGAAALSLAVGGCGGASTTPASIHASVADAARAADCTASGYSAADAAAIQPPAAGPHNPLWADWGVYETAVPEPYLAHNMAHRGVVVRLGAEVPETARRTVIDLWSAAPSYVVVVPGTAGVPSKGVVVTSWQRKLVCPGLTPASVTAVRAYLDAYRGTSGLHPADPTNYSGTAPRPADLPEPVRPDPGA